MVTHRSASGDTLGSLGRSLASTGYFANASRPYVWSYADYTRVCRSYRGSCYTNDGWGGIIQLKRHYFLTFQGSSQPCSGTVSRCNRSPRRHPSQPDCAALQSLTFRGSRRLHSHRPDSACILLVHAFARVQLLSNCASVLLSYSL